ncbi:TatD DNase family Scn1 [Cristinia sonorae]|uniref:TatD DNase family Scn1 n=1 Tax=Cristinia sonorae TaxID=1940300 RepID=A0A8K0XP30_9AGAR|nr:TatD DNase family Scn1 [Cristinia sonorae]
MVAETHLPSVMVLSHVVDVHCHPTDSPISSKMMEDVHIRVCAMSTRASDQPLVRELTQSYPDKVIPCFGYHPWLSHWIATKAITSKEDHYRSLLVDQSKPDHIAAFEKLLPYLPDPSPLSEVIASLREDLTGFPHAMLGEVGLDRSARIPYSPPSPPPYVLHDPEKKDLSPFTIPLEHQVAVLEAQLELAVELCRNASIHSVKAQQATVGLLDRMLKKHGEAWTRISVDMHSCGLSAETWKDIERKHVNAFLSLSTVINSRSPAHKSLIAACSPSRILAESDYNDIRRCTSQTWDMVKAIADIKRWTVEETWEDTPPENKDEWGVVRRLEENWNVFQKGGHTMARKLPKQQ